jgi:hypothetical protein
MVLRYTHVHGAHIDRVIQAIGRALPDLPEGRAAGPGTAATQELPANKAAGAVIQKLHKPPLRAVK